MKKILIIGQALPDVEQKRPYDTTMLYEWLAEIGISAQEAQSIFEFEAVCPVFPGRYANGSHAKPKAKLMADHWSSVLESKVMRADKIILLGKVASEFFNKQLKTWSCNTKIVELPHPSRRNYHLYTQNRESILTTLRSIVIT